MSNDDKIFTVAQVTIYLHYRIKLSDINTYLAVNSNEKKGVKTK